MYYESANKYRYHTTVFLTPPWERIHTNDQERLESFEEAQVIHAEIERVYTQVGYTRVTLPLAPVAERAAFILGSIV